ncbi:MAG: radical SAM protein [Tannerellaceae bacterium]|nr:radical SAM protein [Tannerellaceae bacterium]
MATILFDSIIFGPVNSRRLGVSLGVNLLPPDGKVCSFNCLYCECGLNQERRTHSKMPSREAVSVALEKKLKEMQQDHIMPDVITFAGNGEPTLHPEFPAIIEDTVRIRDQWCPEARIAVLSNATMLHKEEVVEALKKVDDNILKLDSVLDSRIRQLDVPNSPDFTFERLQEQLCRFDGDLIIQTMFLKGEHEGVSVENTTKEEIEGWLEALKKIRPRQVMIYTIDRETPVKGLKKVSREELEEIANLARKEGFEVQVSG